RIGLGSLVGRRSAATCVWHWGRADWRLRKEAGTDPSWLQPGDWGNAFRWQRVFVVEDRGLTVKIGRRDCDPLSSILKPRCSCIKPPAPVARASPSGRISSFSYTESPG